jgi:hypothetical protein
MTVIQHFDKTWLASFGRSITLAGGVAGRQDGKGRLANKLLDPVDHIGADFGLGAIEKLFLGEASK